MTDHKGLRWADRIDKSIQFYNDGRSGPLTTYITALFLHAFHNGHSCLSISGAGFTESVDDLIGALQRDALLPKHLAYEARSRTLHYRTFVSDDSILNIEHQPQDGATGWSFLTISKQQADSVAELLESQLTAPSSRGRVYVLVRGSMGGFEMQTAGTAATPLERGNYTENVLSAFDHTVSEINSSTPHGRLTLIDGPPGTGKTYFVTGLIDAVPEAVFLVIPPDLVAQLAAPDLVGTLLNFRDYSTMPLESRRRRRTGQLTSSTLVLIVEDADHCLLPRGTDNMGSVSSLLNLSDGIMGRLLDLRVVCTTNAKVKEVDSALLRPGRLSAQIAIDRLNPEHARQVRDRLGASQPITRSMTLAEVYDLAALR